MAVPYVSTHAKLLNDLAAHLAAGPAVRSFLGVETAEAARPLIVEVDGPPISQAHIILATPKLRFNRTPGARFTGTGLLGILLAKPVDATHSDTEVQRAALNWFSPVLEWSVRFPRVRDVEDMEPVRLDASDGLPGWMMAGIDLTVDVVLP
jgi:hypothetical protein